LEKACRWSLIKPATANESMLLCHLLCRILLLGPLSSKIMRWCWSNSKK